MHALDLNSISPQIEIAVQIAPTPTHPVCFGGWDLSKSMFDVMNKE